uniref:SusC/RagA family TonB-linked outer membrane protein n=1 Tax=Pedobacter schmidteae TaxID=2201271 RepID=UPI000EAB4AA2|nr:SusC/RagA family TonB-linked outer membrane protein [Pedobacter schmidteae]
MKEKEGILPISLPASLRTKPGSIDTDPAERLRYNYSFILTRLNQMYKIYTRPLRVYNLRIKKLLLIMKLTTIILVTCLLHVSAATFSQKLTLKRKEITLNKVFNEIRKQTGYDVILSGNILSGDQVVQTDFVNTPLSDVMEALTKGRNLSFTIENNSVVIKTKGNGFIERTIQALENIDLSGRITDENKRPLPGVTIKIKGTNRSTMTTEKGDFLLKNVDEKAILVISSIGMETQEIRLRPGQTSLDVVMKMSENELEQVTINTGIFKKADKSFTGASTTVTLKELKDFGNRNLITSLRNIDPSFNILESNAFGSNPNRLPDIQIRGGGNIPNVNQTQTDAQRLNTPLIILDGFQSSLQKLLDINENMVESITLLKDAAATAIYGSRGANGVVVITTRSPRAGKLRVSFGSNLNVEAPDLSGYSLLKAREKLDLELKAGYYGSERADDNLVLNRYYYHFLNEVNKGVETDWMALPLRSGIGQRHNLRLEGGDQSFRYSASAQLNDIQGVMKQSFRKTFNGEITLAYIYKNIRFRNNLQVQQGKTSESPYGTFSEYARMNPYWRAYDDNGKVVKELGYTGNSDYQLYWRRLPTNPLYNASLNTFDKSSTNELINNTSVDWTIIKDLVLRAQLGLTKRTTQADAFRPADHTAFAAYDVDNVFRKGDYKYGITNSFNYDGSLNLNFSRMIADEHLLTAGLDYNMRQQQASGYNFYIEGFPNNNFDFPSMGLQFTKDKKPDGLESLVRSVGFTGNVNYIYSDRYFADISFRLDGSSQFGTNKRLAPFWSTGIGWNLHSEDFLKDNKTINRLKIRGSLGTTGSQNFDAYQALSTYTYYTDRRYFNFMGAYLMGLGNPNLQWQQAMKYNVGADAEFLDRRIKMNADFYYEKTNQVVSSVNLPTANGFPYYIDNIGSMRNKGFEFKATGFLITNPEKFTWSITAAVLQNRNKVLSTSQALKDAQKVILEGTGSPGTLYIDGYSSSTIWVVPSLGIDPSTGKEMYIGKDGIPTYTWKASDVQPVGTTEPTVYGNFSTMLRYKDFSLNASFRYNIGGQQYNETLVNKVETSDYKYNVDTRVYVGRWQQPGDIAAFKGLLVTTPTYKTSRFVQNDKTLVCQNISFQYNLRNPELLKRMGLEVINFSANMADPLYLSSIRRERGTTYPFSRQFSFSINATF